MENAVKNRLNEVLESGVWGTIGPHSVKGAVLLAAYIGASRGLLTHSWTTAYECVLRGLEITRGNAVIVPAYSNPELSLVAVCIGAEPVFCGTGEPDEILIAETLEASFRTSAKPVRAVVMDYIPGISPDLAGISAVCRAHSASLVLAAHGFFSARENGVPLTRFADAVIYTVGSGSELDCGGGGFVATDSMDVYSGAFAYHNCGRSFGEGCTLDCDKLLGGDARITEWNACQVESAIAAPGKAALPERCLMRGQPIFESEYYRRMVG